MRGVRIPPGAAARALARLPGAVRVADPARRLARAPIVWEWGAARLRHYAPAEARAGQRPLLVVYAQVNRPWMLDLAPGHSLIEALRAQGRAVYLLDWGSPGPREAHLGLADYVLTGIDGAVRAAARHAGARAVHLLGVCHGGVLALVYAALRPARVCSFTGLMTQIDFRPATPLAGALCRLADTRWPAGVNVPGAVLAGLFEMLDALRRPPAGGPGNGRSRRLGALLARWLADTPDLPGRAFAEFLDACYVRNALCDGSLDVGGERVDLGALRVPVFNLYAVHDHLVPAAGSAALRDRVRRVPYRELVFPGGHLSLCVSPRALPVVPAGIEAFLRAWDRGGG